MSRLEKLLAVLTALPFGLGLAAAPSPAPDGEVVFAFADPRIIESSGLVARDGLFVTVNDSGDSARVFTVDPATGKTVGETSWAAEPRDIEALAPLPDGDVLVGDIGDNLTARDSITVTRVPVGEGDRQAPATAYDLVYPDRSHDAETLLVHPQTGRVLVASKEFIGRLYVAPEQLSESGPNRLRQVGEVMPIATDGAFFPDGRHLVLRDYAQAQLFTYPGLQQVGEIDLPPQEQGEGIAVDEDGEVYVSSEGVGSEVLRVPLPPRLRALVDGDEPSAGGGSAQAEPGEADAAEGADRPDRSDEPDTVGRDPEEAGRQVLPWAVGGLALAVIVVVLVRSLRPR